MGVEVNKAGYTTQHKSRRLGGGSIAIFPLLKKVGTDGPTDGPTDTRTHPLIELLSRD